MLNTVLSSARSTILRTSYVNVRAIHSTPVAAKTVKEKVSEVADKVNKKVGQGLASAIDTSEKAAQTTKDSLNSAAEQTKKKAEETSNVVGQKANQAATGAREAKEHLEK